MQKQNLVFLPRFSVSLFHVQLQMERYQKNWLKFILKENSYVYVSYLSLYLHIYKFEKNIVEKISATITKHRNMWGFFLSLLEFVNCFDQGLLYLDGRNSQKYLHQTKADF